MRGVFLLLGSLLLAVSTVMGQTIYWAASVVGFSSEGKGEPYSQQYRANQILGKPNRLPQVGDNPCAWSPLFPDGLNDEWITVRFAQSIPLRQIAVFQSGQPGAISNVLAIDGRGREISVFNPAAGASESGNPSLLLIFPKDPSLVSNTLKIVVSPNRVKGLNLIDAVGISSDTQPISVSIHVSKDAPKEIVKENIGKQINTRGQEVAPVISPDGKTLYFTRGQHEKNTGDPRSQDVWYSTLQGNGEWGEAVNMGAPINNADDNAINGMSPDGRTAYLINVYKPDGSVAFGLSRSTRTKKGWSFPVECVIKDNYNLHKNNYTEYAIAPDGRTLVLSVQRKNSLGNKDLYVSFRQPDLSWSEPKSLGPILNTAEYEGAPFVAADGRTLYFTSAGRPEYGNGDIFVSRRLDDTWTNWSEPENLGPSINTPEWDGYFTIPATGDYAYLSSIQNSVGGEDIFRLKLYPAIKPDPVVIVAGQILDAFTKKPIPAELIAVIAEENKEFNKLDYDPESGDYKLILPAQKLYNLSAKREGYFPVTEVVDLVKEKRYKEIRKNILLVPIKSGQKVTLHEVLFEQSKAVLMPGSDHELDRVIEMLNQFPTMEIMVEGHTDNQGEWDKNMKLSEDRVRIVKEYFVEKGIAGARIRTKAWGPSKPISSNETEEKRRLNRRVEFTILKM
ncbi:OmpA family protein [Larkinella soli]|uniref:OmpA family protein n=1 Tax=Larkinella soli TaxID=1770527 RepID=UPI000FFB5880|nr:OmpA family protein [Larkinella soli]